MAAACARGRGAHAHGSAGLVGAPADRAPDMRGGRAAGHAEVRGESVLCVQRNGRRVCAAQPM
ncbi:hypothetical protein XFF6990_140224 [Xanthomonas citri pv. fuscans]|nr:hypothetical protein XFF6990_140224 [Xanthomonas citri pv. fuscans]